MKRRGFLVGLLAALPFVGCRWSDSDMRFKFLTAGQSIDDAQIITQVLNGVSLKPLAPVNMKGYRDLNLNLLVEVTRRSRIAPGLRPLSGVPLGEERELFEFEFYNGSTIVRGPTRVKSNEPEMPMWTVIDVTLGGLYI